MERTRRSAALLYGAVCYAIFFGTFLYLIGFLGNFAVPKSIDSGRPAGLATALAVDAALLALFGLQHSVMARPGFKRVFTRIVPRSVERSTYVLASSLVLLLLFWAWQPIPGLVWSAPGPLSQTLLVAGTFLGYGIVLYSTLLIDHFDLFGLRQVFLRWRGESYTEKRFAIPGLYRWVRHPIYVGWLVGFWVTPSLSLGHLLFALANTAYILVAIRYEERDLAAVLGDPYLRWRERTPKFVPRLGASARPVGSTQEA